MGTQEALRRRTSEIRESEKARERTNRKISQTRTLLQNIQGLAEAIPHQAKGRTDQKEDKRAGKERTRREGKESKSKSKSKINGDIL